MSLYLRGHTQFLFLTETFQITPPFCLNMCSLVMDLIESGLETGRWFSPDTPVSSTDKTDHHDITEILLKVALNTITLTLNRIEKELQSKFPL